MRFTVLVAGSIGGVEGSNVGIIYSLYRIDISQLTGTLTEQVPLMIGNVQVSLMAILENEKIRVKVNSHSSLGRAICIYLFAPDNVRIESTHFSG